MDYTPISARKVLLAFSFTAFVALVPALFVFLQVVPIGPQGGNRGVLLALATVALTLVLLALTSVAIMFGRRLVRRPSRV